MNAVKKFKGILSNDSVKEQFQNSLNKNAGAFTASLVELFSGDKYLQGCQPSEVVQQALKAASLNLPINKNLGYAYIIPRKEKGLLKPNFQIGYKGYIQLAMRTGQYKTINADAVPTGINVEKNLLSGEIKFTGEADNEGIQGYFAHFELLNGFQKTYYMTKDQVEKHAKRYVPGYTNKYMPWQTEFSSMAKKTVLSALLRTYGIMSTEMMSAISKDGTYDEEPEQEKTEEPKFDIPEDESLLDDPIQEDLKEMEEIRPDAKENEFMQLLTNTNCDLEKLITVMVELKHIPKDTSLIELIESEMFADLRTKMKSNKGFLKSIIEKVKK